MAGLIKREDIDLVRERARIDDVVGEHVTLRSAGVGSMKGLCPFHDERTPSFHVRPQLGLWHCFGCAEGGDVFSFVQKINHLSFAEAVEFLAAKYGVDVRYEDGGRTHRGPDQSQRRRLLEAHRVAEEYYCSHLLTPAGKEARDFLGGRGFGRSDVERFGVGSSPADWDNLTRLLRSRSFTEEELVTSGLAIRGPRGLYDRFRGRVMWPIRDVTGATVGFGARRLGEDPKSPKYLNTPETPIYHKSQVLYGLDLAKKDIARRHRVIVVEGYTDVMAAHAAGETTAVATCGTAFGKDHTQLIRRLLGDVDNAAAGVMLADGRARGGEVIFTFDGDEAGKAAARRAYMEDQAFAAQTFVAVDPNGMDPCDLRVSGGDAALQQLIASRVPLFEFVLRSVVTSLDLDTAEGRVQGLRTAAPILAGIKDHALRTEYARQVAGWLGLDPREVDEAQRRAGREAAQRRRAEASLARKPHVPSGRGYETGVGAASTASDGRTSTGPQMHGRVSTSALDGSDRNAEGRGGSPLLPLLPDGAHGHSAERLALAATLQGPLNVIGAGIESLPEAAFRDGRNRAIFVHMCEQGLLESFFNDLQEAENEVGVGDASIALATRRWTKRLVDTASPQVAEDLTALMVLSLPVDEGAQRDYAQGLVRALVRGNLEERMRILQAHLSRLDVHSGDYREVEAELWEVGKARRSYMSTGEL